LSDADRIKFGCPEFLPVSIDAITNREAIALQKAGYPTPRLFREALRVKPVIDPATGEPYSDGDYTIDIEAWTALVWLALRRAGVDTDLATLEWDIDGVDYLPDEETAAPVTPEVEPGKAARSRASAKRSSNGGVTSRAKSTRTGSRS
jgi:hypothetical protein